MRARRNAFTMIELLMVISIMAIIVVMVAMAARGGIRRAEEKATIGLIAKLEAAMTDRVDAIQSEHPNPTTAHIKLATSILGGTPVLSIQRAQVLAFYDNLRAELPDVWVYESGDTNYPCNFGGVPFGSTGTWADYVLPLGADGVNVPFTGIKGASFAAASGIYAQLGYGPQGYDGADNSSPPNGLIDELSEATIGMPAGTLAKIQANLAKHRHKTARSEMLYALLVAGTGPLGSSFNPEDFGAKEVADTDGDGLMEFVDAWGEPLQFYRWPVLYHSDTQRGFPDLETINENLNAGATPGPYVASKVSGVPVNYEAREVNTLDPNQTLLAPSWWGSMNQSTFGATAVGPVSGPAVAFQTYFHTLVDPLAISNGSPSSATYWDRSAVASSKVYGTLYPRRAYYHRFLILSGGPDKIPGVAQLSGTNGSDPAVDYRVLDERYKFPLPGGGYTPYPPLGRDSTGAPVPATAANCVQIEGQAGKVDPNRSGPLKTVIFPDPSNPYRNDTNTFLEMASEDDITSQNIHALGGPLK